MASINISLNEQQRRTRSDLKLDGDRQFSDVVVRFSDQVKEIKTWLRNKGKQLQQRLQEQPLDDASFNELLYEYEEHEKFMTEIGEFCHTITRCKEEGQELRDGDIDITDEDRDEIGILMDKMLVEDANLKFLASERLKKLQQTIEERQISKIERLEKWLTTTEIRLASSDNIGPDHDAIQRQISDIEELRRELEQKQEFLNLVSRFIVFDEVDLQTSQMRSRPCDFLEKRLENMNARWTQICNSVNHRHERLKKADSIWKLLRLEGPQLFSWLRKIEMDLNELTDATRNITDPHAEKAFITKLLSRYEKIELEMRSKQSFYTSLEKRLKDEIKNFDDPCSIFVIELERKIEDMQENWNLIMNQNRMVDYSLKALLNPDPFSKNTSRPIIPIPDPITSLSNSDELMPESMGDDDSESSPRLNGSLSDAKAFDNSTSSQETRSLMYGSNNYNPCVSRDQSASFNDSHEGFSSATNLTSPKQSHLYNVETADDTNYSMFLRTNHQHDYLEDNELTNVHNDTSTFAHDDHNDTHSCRVEQWKHSLESFSSWLRQVEESLGMCTGSDLSELDTTKTGKTWSELDLQGQLSLIKDIETRIASTCQLEFDCLFSQGHLIIEDLLPEINENEYETNLNEILARIEMRFNEVKQCLADRRRELCDREKWSRLSRDLQNTCNFLIDQMGEVMPETMIGVDMITLAQQQDQLMHSKEELENNTMMNSCIQEAKLFLKLCDSLQQQYGQSQHLASPETNDFSDIWKSFNKFRDEIETHLDRLTLHYLELSQSIQDRLARLDEVHKKMHDLQHNIQELATKLQVAEILKSKWVPLDNLSIEQLSEQLEDLKLYRERLTEVESTYRGMNLIVDWMEQSSAPLSQSNLKRIDELNNIWDLIQDSVENRQKLIEHAFDEQSSSEQKFLTQTVADLPKWERRVATSKVPYFIDHESNKTLWDHPKFTHILNSMDECKNYVFSVYRTAMKLRIIQKRLGIDKLMLEQLKELLVMIDIVSANRTTSDVDNLDSQSVQTNSLNNNDTPVGIEQIILLLKAIYEKIQSIEIPSLDVPLAIDLTLNWLLNLYDSTRTGQVSALSLKVGLAVLCCATREEKYIFMFELVANQRSGTIDAKKLGTLFEICMRIPLYLGESESFGGSELIETSIRNCFAMSKFNPHHPNCIDLNDYLNWLKTEPQFIIWLPVLHRLLLSEDTTHPAKCKLCGANPIKGLRYRCLRCFKYNICQKCFLTGRHVYEHFDPAKHPMQEYCCKTSTGEGVRNFAKILRNKLHLGTNAFK